MDNKEIAMDIKIELQACGGADLLAVAPYPAQTPGKGEVRIRQAAAGVNFVDIYHREGSYPLPLPAVLGVEGAGVVEALGEDVEGLSVGDRVAYAGIPGGYASTRLLPAWRAVRLPDAVDAPTAAVSMLRGMTAHMLFTRTCPAWPGMRVLVLAAAGGLGVVLTRWAKRLGCEVIGTASSEEKAAIARANGADHLVIGRGADLVGEIGRLTNGQGVDFAIDGLGGDALLKTLACVRPFGTVASIGQAAGPIMPIPISALSAPRCLNFSRPSITTYVADPATYEATATAVIEAIAVGIMPPPAHSYPLADGAQAQRDLESGKTTGSIVLIP